MRYSKIVLLSTLSAFALLAASSASSRASLFERSSAADMGMLKPQGVWQVGSVDAKNANYCAMVNQFDKEITLAFARSANGYGSLAINFPGNVLDAGATYPVTLQVDDMEARSYNVKASSASSIIVQIGQDEDFYSSLGGNGTLRISMPAMDMKFDLKKFSGSYISLVSCADKLPQQHDGPRVAAMPVPSVEKSPLPDSGKSVKTAALTPPEAAAKPAASVPVKLAAPAQKQADSVQAQVDAVHKSLQNKDVKTAQAPAPSPAAPVAKPVVAAAAVTAPVAASKVLWNASDESAVKTLADENNELKNKLALAEATQADLSGKIETLKTEKIDLQSRLDMQNKQANLMEAALSGKEQDLSSVRTLSVEDSKTLAEVRTELANLKRDHSAAMANLQSKLAEKTAQYDLLQKQFTVSEQTRRSAEQQATQTQAELDLARQRLSQAQSELELSHQNLTQAQSQISSMEMQKSELTTQLDTQGTQNKTVLQKMQEQLDRAHEQISMLEGQVMSVAMQRDDLASQLDVQSNKNKALNETIEAKNNEISALRDRKSEFVAETDAEAKKAAAKSAEVKAPVAAAPGKPAPNTAALTPMRTVTSSKGDSPSELPPALRTAAEKAEKAAPEKTEQNLSSSEKTALPAITATTTPQSAGQDEGLFAPPVVKASATPAATSAPSHPASDDNWDTIVVQ